MDLYDAIKNSNHNVENIAVTVLDGPAAGEKALVAGGLVTWRSEEDGFITAHEQEIVSGADGLREIGGARVFREILGREKKLVICGGGHVSIPVIQIGRMIGCHVTVLEDRPLFANNAREAGANVVILDSFENGLAQIEGDGDTFFVVVTRGHSFDKECLESILKKSCAYVGMIGSKRRVALLKERLEEEGFSRAQLDGIHSPIGLPIGGETPAEIGISIIAEIIEVKNKSKRNFVYTKEMLSALTDKNAGRQVLATIIARRGSAPRGVGTKMVIREDGTCVGTIGGGCAEADTTARALEMIAADEKGPVIHRTDMTGSGMTEDEGMVCGGMIDVMLEQV